jgi:hypothetical protein
VSENWVSVFCFSWVFHGSFSMVFFFFLMGEFWLWGDEFWVDFVWDFLQMDGRNMEEVSYC